MTLFCCLEICVCLKVSSFITHSFPLFHFLMLIERSLKRHVPSYEAALMGCHTPGHGEGRRTGEDRRFSWPKKIILLSFSNALKEVIISGSSSNWVLFSR